MAIPTRRVTGPVSLPDGEVPVGARVTLELTGLDVEGEIGIVPQTQDLALDADGVFDATLWCTDAGAHDLHYEGRIFWYSATRARERSRAFILRVVRGAGDLPFAPLWGAEMPEGTESDARAQREACAPSAPTRRAARRGAAGDPKERCLSFPTVAAAQGYVDNGGVFESGRAYSIAGALYVGRAGRRYIPGLTGLVPLPVGMTLRNGDSIYCVLLAGQSWAVGSDENSDGSLWTVRSGVQVWSPDGSGKWGVPIRQAAPFNTNHPCLNEGVEFCNRLREEIPIKPRLYVNAAGGRPIADWVGTPEDRTVSAANRRKWVQLRAMLRGGAICRTSLSGISRRGTTATCCPTHMPANSPI